MNERGKNMGSCMSSADYVNDKNHSFRVPFEDIYPYVPVANNDPTISSKRDERALAKTLLQNYRNLLKKYDILDINTQRMVVQKIKNAFNDNDISTKAALEAAMRGIDFYGSCLYNSKLVENEKLNLTSSQKNTIYSSMRGGLLRAFGMM